MTRRVITNVTTTDYITTNVEQRHFWLEGEFKSNYIKRLFEKGDMSEELAIWKEEKSKQSIQKRKSKQRKKIAFLLQRSRKYAKFHKENEIQKGIEQWCANILKKTLSEIRVISPLTPNSFLQKLLACSHHITCHFLPSITSQTPSVCACIETGWCCPLDTYLHC